MPYGFIDATELETLDAYFGATTLGPATWYVGLFTTMPNDAGSGGTEVSGGSYARVAVTNNGTNFPSANPKITGTAVTFPTATGSWGTVVGYGFFTASSGGTAKFVGKLLSGYKTVSAVDTSTEVITATGHGRSVADRVQLEVYNGSLPGGISADTDYVVATVPDANTLTLTGVNITSSGSGWIQIAKSSSRSIIADDTPSFAAGALSVSLD